MRDTQKEAETQAKGETGSLLAMAIYKARYSKS